MKLKTFNEDNLPKVDRSSPKVYLNSKTGIIHFNRAASARIGFVAGDGVEFHQDEEEPSDWYVTKSKVGFKLRNKGKEDDDSLGVTFNSSSLARLIIESVTDKVQMGSCGVAAEPNKVGKVEYWPLITAKLTASV